MRALRRIRDSEELCGVQALGTAMGNVCVLVHTGNRLSESAARISLLKMQPGTAFLAVPPNILPQPLISLLINVIFTLL